MKIETLFHSVEQIETGVKDIYQYFLEFFYDQEEYRQLWEEMLAGESNQIELLDRCRIILSSTPHTAAETIGRDTNFQDLLSIIEQYKRDIKEDLTINRALKIAFHLELLEIQGTFNEIIKLPREPFFEILSEIHLEIRKNMGRLIEGIENFSTDKDFLYKVLDLKGTFIEKRSGRDRRSEDERFTEEDRRNSDRRQGKLVKIICNF